VSASTIVLQSQREDRLHGWQGACCASVEAWAGARGFTYRFEGDECFARIPAYLRRRFGDQPVVLMDLARLLWLREVLEEGYVRALWIDADVLLFRPFAPAGAGDWLGREHWIQKRAGRLRTYPKVHNAFLQIDAGSSFLPFYIDRAAHLLERVDPPVVPQFIGPKLLTAWHNLVPFNVEERIGMCSPLVMRDLLAVARDGDGAAPAPALERLLRGHAQSLCGLNLCASYEGRDDGGLRHESGDYGALVEALESGRLDPWLQCSAPAG